MTLLRSALVLLLTLSALLVSSPARAEDAALEAKARLLHRSASGHFEAGRYVEAQADFSAGYELSHKPGFLWNMAECARLLGRGERALELYRQFVSQAPGDSPQKVAAQQRVRELEISRANVRATFNLQPAPAAAAPPAPASTLVAAPARAAVPSARAADEAALASRSGPTRPVIFAPAPEPAPREGQRPFTTKWWFWTAAAGVAVAAIVTTAVVVNQSPSDGSSPTIPSGNTVVSWR